MVKQGASFLEAELYSLSRPGHAEQCGSWEKPPEAQLLGMAMEAHRLEGVGWSGLHEAAWLSRWVVNFCSNAAKLAMVLHCFRAHRGARECFRTKLRLFLSPGAHCELTAGSWSSG